MARHDTALAAERPARPAREALFVRIPAADAQRLDRAAFELRRSKQDIVSELVARYVEGPGAAPGAAAPDAVGPCPTPSLVRAEAAPPAREPAAGRPPGLGRHRLAPAPEPADEVLTLAGAALLLHAAEADVGALAEAGELPARRVGGAWRFARSAVLAWLGADGLR